MPSTLRQKQGRLRQYSMDYFNENAQLADVRESMVPSYVEDAMAKEKQSHSKNAPPNVSAVRLSLLMYYS